MFYNNITYEVAGDDQYTVNSPHYSFVGILKRGSQTIFRLPIGYPEPESTDQFNTTRDLHIKFYKLFRLFRDAVEAKQGETGQSKIGSHTPQATNREDKDGEYIMNHDEGQVYYYRKLDAFDSLLDAYDPVRIIALENRLRIVTDDFDIRNFQNILGSAVFFADNSFYIDKDYQPRPTLTLATTDIVGLYSFLLSDMRAHLYPDNNDPAPLHPEVMSTAEDFQARHLWPAASCWEEDQWEATKATCIDLLDAIHKHTALKDEDYWKIYEALERFLFDDFTEKQGTEDGEMIWGLEGFWPVWEFLCYDILESFALEDRKAVRYADPKSINRIQINHKDYNDNITESLKIKSNYHLRPDAVTTSLETEECFKFRRKALQLLSEHGWELSYSSDDWDVSDSPPGTIKLDNFDDYGRGHTFNVKLPSGEFRNALTSLTWHKKEIENGGKKYILSDKKILKCFQSQINDNDFSYENDNRLYFFKSFRDEFELYTKKELEELNINEIKNLIEERDGLQKNSEEKNDVNKKEYTEAIESYNKRIIELKEASANNVSFLNLYRIIFPEFTKHDLGEWLLSEKITNDHLIKDKRNHPFQFLVKNMFSHHKQPIRKTENGKEISAYFIKVKKGLIPINKEDALESSDNSNESIVIDEDKGCTYYVKNKDEKFVIDIHKECTVIDFKYKNYDNLHRNNDVRKQYVYEHLISHKFKENERLIQYNFSYSSMFFLPHNSVIEEKSNDFMGIDIKYFSVKDLINRALGDQIGQQKS
ncbi:MAG: hypothetical protein ACOCUT_02675 [bacterium]